MIAALLTSSLAFARPTPPTLVTWSLEGGRELGVTGQAGGRWGAPAPYEREPGYTAAAHADALTAWISSRDLADPDRDRPPGVVATRRATCRRSTSAAVGDGPVCT